MMKDIYSPLEIDEQWDQRAEMQEGDAAAAPATTESAATTATMEPVAETTETQGVPAPDHAEPGSVEPASDDTPHIALHAEDNQMAPEADTATAGMSDDEAVAKLAGDEKTEEANTDPSDNAMEASTINPQSGDTVIPTTKIEPTEPRVQPDEKSDTPMAVESHDDAVSTDNPDATSNEHFVLGAQPEASTEAPAADTVEEEKDEAATLTPTETEEPAEEGIDSTIEAAMSKIKEAAEMLKAEKEKIAARIQEHEQAETEARTKKEQDQKELSRIEDELDKLDKLQPAA